MKKLLAFKKKIENFLTTINSNNFTCSFTKQSRILKKCGFFLSDILYLKLLSIEHCKRLIILNYYRCIMHYQLRIKKYIIPHVISQISKEGVSANKKILMFKLSQSQTFWVITMIMF